MHTPAFPDAPRPAGRTRILHVDDTEATRYVTSRSLRAAGFEVTEVATGLSALDALPATRPDLVILDVKLPDLSGFDVCRRIKADPETRGIPVLLLSAVMVATRHKVEGLEVGADAYLVHPVEPVELIATVKALLRIRRGEEAVRAMNQMLERRVEERTAELLSSRQLLRQLVGELGRAEQRERQRLAAEMHDNLVQLLAVCKMRASALASTASDPAETRREAAALTDFLDDGIAFARSLMAELGPVPLNDHDLGASLEALAERMKRHGLRVRVVDDGGPTPLNEDVAGLLFRGARELLFNVVKHAGAAEATVTLSRAGRELRVTVSDAGVGFDPAAARAEPSGEGGFGLLSLRERLSLIGGRFEIDSAPGRGTRATMVAPLSPETDSQRPPAPRS